MDKFKNIKQAHEYFNFPGSYRTGTLIKDSLVIRIYRNGVAAPDYFSKSNKKKKFFYVIKSAKILEAFKNNKINNKLINVFTKDILNNNVVYHGLYKVMGFRQNKKYVCLEKLN